MIDLKNTSNEISNPLKLYSSVLTDEYKGWQYKFFSIENRSFDIEEMNIQLNIKKNQLDSYFKNS